MVRVKGGTPCTLWGLQVWLRRGRRTVHAPSPLWVTSNRRAQPCGVLLGVPGVGGSSSAYRPTPALAPRPRAGLGDSGGPGGPAARLALHSFAAAARRPLLRRHPHRAQLRAVGSALSERRVSVSAGAHIESPGARGVGPAQGGGFRQKREGLQGPPAPHRGLSAASDPGDPPITSCPPATPGTFDRCAWCWGRIICGGGSEPGRCSGSRGSLKTASTP